jgi:hypothetical protein
MPLSLLKARNSLYTAALEERPQTLWPLSLVCLLAGAEGWAPGSTEPPTGQGNRISGIDLAGQLTIIPNS